MKKSFEMACLEQALEQLFAKHYFDITLLRDIGDMLGRNVQQSQDYKYLHALHCIHYADMAPEIREQLQERVIGCLRGGFLPGRVLARAVLIEGNDFTDAEDAPLRLQ